MQRRRVAVTGLGVISSAGIGIEAFWRGLLAPQPQGNRAVPDFDPTPYFDNPKEVRRADRYMQFALAAAAEALQQAGDLRADPDRIGVWIGTGVGGIATLEEQIIVRHEKGERRVSPFLVPMMMANAAAAAVSMKYGFQGPCENTVTACAAGTQSIGNAARLIQDGRCDIVVTGGSEASLTPTSIAGFANMTALSTTGYSRPFDRDRDGFVLGEGAAILVIEERERALARGATIIAEIAGGASTADAHHITAPHPDGDGAERAIRLALEDAGLSPADIGYVNAHGTGTELNDRTEGKVIARVFDRQPPVSSVKGVTGHALGASGAIEAAATVLAIDRGELPPNAGLVEKDPEIPLDNIATERTSWNPRPAISNSFGFGGHNTVLVFGPAE